VLHRAAAKDIEDRIIAREAEGTSHQEAELKGVEEYYRMFNLESCCIRRRSKLF
jgi:hypothetical protein